MKHLVRILSLGAAMIASVSVASATPISGTIGFQGFGTLSSTGAFTAGSNIPGQTGNATVNTVATGTLAGFTYGNLASFFSFNTGTVLGPISPSQNVFTTTEVISGVSTTLSLVLTGLTIAPASNPQGFGFTGMGILSETGYTNTLATFSVNTNSQAGTFVTFDTVAATPEPSSLIMLGTGLISAAGMMVRRRKIS